MGLKTAFQEKEIFCFESFTALKIIDAQLAEFQHKGFSKGNLWGLEGVLKPVEACEDKFPHNSPGKLKRVSMALKIAFALSAE